MRSQPRSSRDAELPEKRDTEQSEHCEDACLGMTVMDCRFVFWGGMGTRRECEGKTKKNLEIDLLIHMQMLN